MDLQHTLDVARRVLTTTIDEAKAALDQNQGKEAKRVLTSGLRELRDLKREVADAEREVRAQFQEARLKISSSGQVVGAFAGSKARGAMGRARAMDKRSLAARQASSMNEYRRLKSMIDGYISELDNLKFGIDPDNSDQRSSGTPPASSSAPPPPPTPAAWAPDPFGRHEHRYWNGTTWTEHVADGGVQGTDPPSPSSR